VQCKSFRIKALINYPCNISQNCSTARAVYPMKYTILTKSAQLALYKLKPNKPRTHNSDFLLRNEHGAVSTYVTKFSNKSEANYLKAQVNIESGGTQNVCLGILYNVTNC